ncbi:MAG TPA: hypothetical protein VMG10_23910 [Gemmataceae bacterium]|nr:hypothetical protein [Gemmataceae bacterium]
MNPRRNRWLLRLAVVLVVGILALFWAVGERTRTLTIENLAQQPISELKITVGAQTRTFQDVEVGKKVTVPCQVRGDERFTVEGRLTDDTRIRANGRIGDNVDYVLLPGGSLEPRRKASR